MRLLFSRRLLPLLAAQTLGAAADNLFKNALVVLLLFRAGQHAAPMLVALSGGVFILPFALFSATAGQVAERWNRSRLIRLSKLAEIALMLVGAAGFLVPSVPLLFVVLFGLGVQAAFFGPLKYGILPALLRGSELLSGNGLMEAGTFLGILFGTIAGSALFALPRGAAIVSATGLAASLLGLFCAAFIPSAPSLTPGLRISPNIARETVSMLRDARRSQPVWLSVLGISWFWAIGAVILSELPTLVRDALRAPPGVFSLMLGCFAVGIASGSVLCGRLSRAVPPTRIAPFALAGLSALLFDFGRTAAGAGALPGIDAVLGSATGLRMLADLLLLSACGGLYSVPLYAILQERSGDTEKARMVAANNLLNAAAMVAAALAIAGLIAYGVTPAVILQLGAVANLAVALWVGRVLPRGTGR